MYGNDIHVVDVVKCHDVNCKSHEHIQQIDQLYAQLYKTGGSSDKIITDLLH